MPVSRPYRCPECQAVFTYLHHPSVEADPVKCCPRCAWRPEADAVELVPEITAPHIQNVAVVKGADYTYRAMEESSRNQMYAAAEASGVDVSDVRDMAITDMKDNLREGEIAAMPVKNSVTELMAQAPGTGFAGEVSQAMSYAAATRDGPHPFAGMRASSMVKQVHGATGGYTSEITTGEIAARQAAQAPQQQRRVAGSWGRR